jgi:hypothetical protein
LLVSGTLCVFPRFEDPWVPAEWPTLPPALGRLLIERQRVPGSSSQLADYLAGVGPLECSPTDLQHCFLVYAESDALSALGVRRPLREAISDLLAQDPVAALDAALSTNLSNAAVVPALIQSGLAAEARDCFVAQGVTPVVWSRCPAAAIVGSSSRLALDRSGFGASLREDAEFRCGHAWHVLTAGEPDPWPSAGAFDQTAVHLAALSKEQLDTLWRAAAVVPNALLDSDSRSAAARELFDARNRPAMRRLADDAEDRSRSLREMLVAAGEKQLDRAIAARGSKPGWLSLPTLSLAFAAVARLAARERSPFRESYENSIISDHARFARHAPGLAGLDIALAEGCLLGAELQEGDGVGT